MKAYFSGSPADKLKYQSRFTSGIRIFDISKPDKPHDIRFMPVTGLGPHRIWYTGGRYAYASTQFADFADHIFAVIDVSDPRKPALAGRWWLPGMWRAGGETPSWRQGKRYALDHGLTYDIADPFRPCEAGLCATQSPLACWIREPGRSQVIQSRDC
jgi:hypothetical protein